MSCDTIRKRLWKKLALNLTEMEAIYLTAKNKAQENRPSKAERKLWVEKTERLFSFFDYHELARPVHSTTGLPKLSSLAGYAALWDELENRQAMNIEQPSGILQADLIKFLAKLGELASSRKIKIELAILGRAAMVLGYSVRVATLDIVLFLFLPKTSLNLGN